MSSAMNHRARSRRSYAKHRSACSGHASRTIYQQAFKKQASKKQASKKQPGLLGLLRGAIKPRGREAKADAE